MSDEIHAPTALPLDKGPPPCECEAGGSQSLSGNGEEKNKINMARITPIAREAFVPIVKPAKDSIAIGHTGSDIAVTQLKNESFKYIETKPVF